MQSKNSRTTKGRWTADLDFQGIKHYKPMAQGTNFVLLDPDVAAVFRDPEFVNQLLRSLIGVADQLGQVALMAARHENSQRGRELKGE